MKRIAGAIAIVAAASAAMAVNGSVSAHLTAVSPYTYWRDVLPILEARCGRCHTDGNAAGVSLLNYPSARGAMWLIRQRLIRGHMPPWFAEGPFKSPAPVTARELNILMTWASGGGPEGMPAPRTAHPAASWPIGPPDLVVAMPSAFTFPADQGDQVHETRLPSAKIGGRTIRTVDLLPGTPALVRSAEIIARGGGRDQVLGLWQPGELPSPLAVNAGFRVAPDATLVLRIRYRRHYGAPPSDRSQVGVYFGNRQTAGLQTIELSTDVTRPQIHTIDRRTRVLAIRPIAGPAGTIVRVTTIGAGTSRRELGLIQIQPEWARRYVFDAPVTIEPGNRIELSVMPSDAVVWASLTNERSGADSAVRLALEVLR